MLRPDTFLEENNTPDTSDEPGKSDKLKSWFVLRDFKKFNSKNPAYKELPKQGVECFTPMRWIVTGRYGKKKREYVPVIQNLLFAHESRDKLDPIISQTDRLQYQFARGGGQGTPMIVPDKDMERFINAVNNDDSPVYYTPEELTADMIGKEVVINGEPLNGYRGKLLKMQGSKKRRLIVEVKGLLVAAIEVNPDYVQIIKNE